MLRVLAVASSLSIVASTTETKSATKTTMTTTKDTKTVMTLNMAQSLADVELSTGCSPPTILGGTGYCGPDFCGAFPQPITTYQPSAIYLYSKSPISSRVGGEVVVHGFGQVRGVCIQLGHEPTRADVQQGEQF